MIESSLRHIIPYDNVNADAWRKAMTATCESFAASGLCDTKILAEMKCMDKSKTWSCISEALVYSLLKEKDFASRKNLGSGPDFLVTDGEKRVWIEVVCPEPSGLPEDWLNFDLGKNGLFRSKKFCCAGQAPSKHKQISLIHIYRAMLYRQKIFSLTQ